jgi:hypothetical protein
MYHLIFQSEADYKLRNKVEQNLSFFFVQISIENLFNLRPLSVFVAHKTYVTLLLLLLLLLLCRLEEGGGGGGVQSSTCHCLSNPPLLVTA